MVTAVEGDPATTAEIRAVPVPADGRGQVNTIKTYTRSSIQSTTPMTPTIISGIAKIFAPASAPRPYAPARGGVECLVVA